MKLTVVFLFLLFLSYSHAIWPKPASITTGNSTVYLDYEKFEITTNTTSQVFQRAMFRYRYNLFFPFQANGDTPKPTLVSLYVGVLSNDETLQLYTNENYQLTISSNSTVASIIAPTIYGAMRGIIYL